MGRIYYVYIMASWQRTIYVGMTNDLMRRVWQHRNKVNEGSFTTRYNCTRLVLYEDYPDPLSAIGREKEIKGWRREKKVALIDAMNPMWRDFWPDIAG
jgi:putative endonuclease